MNAPYFIEGDIVTSSLTNQVYEIFDRNLGYDYLKDCYKVKVRLSRNFYHQAILAGKHVPYEATIMSESDFEEFRLGKDTDETYQRSKQNDSFQKHGLKDSRVLLINKYKNR